MRKKVVNAGTKLFAILGEPIAHSLSPVIMNEAFDRKNMDCIFLAFRSNPQELDTAIKAMRGFKFSGYVFTMPVKEEAVRHMDALEEEADLIQAVNCAKLDNGRLIGYNTDSRGFWDAIDKQNTQNRPIRKAFVMGMGGFSRAAIAQLALRGVKDIVVANKLEEKNYVTSFELFAERVRKKLPDVNLRYIDWVPKQWERELENTDLIANGTANGMYGKGDLGEIFPYKCVPSTAIFFDAVYAPLNTPFLEHAKAKGYMMVDGLELLIHQGLCSFEIWTGIKADACTMRKDALKFLQEQVM